MKTTAPTPVVTNSWKVKMEKCTAGRSEMTSMFSPSPETIRAKATLKVEGKGETDKECFRCGRTGHIRADCRAKTHTLMEDHLKSAPKGKGVGSYEEEESETSPNVPLKTIDLGSFEVLSEHGDTEEDVDVDGSSQEATEIMPPLPPASW